MAEYLRLTGGGFATPVETGAGDESMVLHAKAPHPEPPNAEPPSAVPPKAGPPSFMLPLPKSCPADVEPGCIASSIAGLENVYSPGRGRVNSKTARSRLAHLSRSTSPNDGNSVGVSSSNSPYGDGTRRPRSTGPQQNRQDGRGHEQKDQRSPAPARANVFTHQLFSVNLSSSRAKGGESIPPAAARSLRPPLSSAMAWPKSARSGPWSRRTGARQQEYRSHRAARMRAAGVDTALVTREALEESEKARASFFVRIGENGESAIDPLKTLEASVRALGRLGVLGEKRAAARGKPLPVREQRQSASPVSAGGRDYGAELRRPGDSERGSSALAAAYGGGIGSADAPLGARAGQRALHERISGGAAAVATTAGGRRVAGADTLSGATSWAAVTEGSCPPSETGASVLAPGVSSSRKRDGRLECSPRKTPLESGGCGGSVGGGRGSSSSGMYGGGEGGEDAEGEEEREENGEDAGVRRRAATEDAARQPPPPPEVEPAPAAAALGGHSAYVPRPSTTGVSAAAGRRAEARRVRPHSSPGVAKGTESGTDGDVAREEAENTQRLQSKRKADCLIEATRKRPASPLSSSSEDHRGRRCEAPANDDRVLRFGSLPPGLGPFGAGVDRSLGTSSFSIQASCDVGR